LALLWASAICAAEPTLGERAAAQDQSAALERADRSVAEAAARVADDPARPQYHLLPTAQWNNDPNGPILHGGYYHLFFQHNPYGDGWGHMHWGHARSRDLVRWERLPIALAPSLEQGEEHCFSGCAVITRAGQPLLIYTSIGPNKSAADAADQWAALGSPDLLSWKKHPANPVLSEALHGDQKIYDWRDPFVFEHSGRTLAVLGGNLNRGQGGQAIVALYEAENDELTRWKYRGILFRHPDAEVGNIECPNFFPLDGRWVLIVSPHRPVEWFVGDFDADRGEFAWKTRGLVDPSDHYYAPNGLVDAQGRRVLWGWIRGFPGGRGWNGCLGLPRVLGVDAQGRLTQQTLPELSGLRGKPGEWREIEIPVDGERNLGLAGRALEVEARFAPGPGGEVGLRLQSASQPEKFVDVTLRAGELEVAGAKAPLDAASEGRTLRLFLDHSVLEAACGPLASITRVLEFGDGPIEIVPFAKGGTGKIEELTAWELGAIWDAPNRRP
jgi:beta-fructofuranosidase